MLTVQDAHSIKSSVHQVLAQWEESSHILGFSCFNLSSLNPCPVPWVPKAVLQDIYICSHRYHIYQQ